MRKLSIEKMSVTKDAKKMDAVVGGSFERNKNAENEVNRSEEIIANTLNGWTRLICLW